VFHSTVKQTYELELPNTPYALFVRGELDEVLGLPDDGSRVEVVGGEIVVSPAPKNPHRGIVALLAKAFNVAQALRDDFPWEVDQGLNLDLVGVEDGCIPDLVVADRALLEAAWRTTHLCLVSDEIEMVVEVTSRSTKANDRPPKDGCVSKWTSYARSEIPYYLLVDCDPQVSTITLYSIPDGKTGAYLARQSWKFGEVVDLTEPFDLRIPTDQWGSW